MYGHIYLITHLPSGKYYVGQTIRDPFVRWRSHLLDAKSKDWCRIIIDREISRYGEDQFAFEVICSASTPHELDLLERAWIWALHSRNRDKGFNVSTGGTKSPPGPKPNKIVSEETRRKMSEAAKQRCQRPEWIEHCRKIMRENRAGKRWTMSEASRKNLSIARKKWCDENPEAMAEKGKANTVSLKNRWAKLSDAEIAKAMKPARDARWPK